jgi:hypothetical protein
MNALEQRIDEYRRDGCILLNHTSDSAQLSYPKDSPSCIPTGILFLLNFLVGIIYLIYSSSKGGEIITLVLNNQGLVQETSKGRGWGIWPFIIIAILFNAAIIVTIILLLGPGVITSSFPHLPTSIP